MRCRARWPPPAGASNGCAASSALYQENLRLAEENRKLLQWQQVALKLSAENEAMRGLLKVVPENGVSYVTARLIGNSGGGYVRTVMVNAGADQGAARGQAAIAEGGLIGRLTEVGSRAARVLLITDLNSRIPVVIAEHRGPAPCWPATIPTGRVWSSRASRRRSRSATAS